MKKRSEIHDTDMTVNNRQRERKTRDKGERKEGETANKKELRAMGRGRKKGERVGARRERERRTGGQFFSQYFSLLLFKLFSSFTLLFLFHNEQRTAGPLYHQY